MSEIYRLNKDLYDVNVTDIQRAANEINKKYLGFDGDKKVFEEMIKFDDGKDIWEPRNETHEYCHYEKEYTNGYIFFFKIHYPNHFKIKHNLTRATSRLYLAYQDEEYNVKHYRIAYNSGLPGWIKGDAHSYDDLKEDEAINKFRHLILDHAKIIEKSKKKFW